MIVSLKRSVVSPMQLLSSGFCLMLKDVNYNTALGMFEKADGFLNEMWRPTGPDEATKQFAVSSEKERLTHLAYNWIGHLPPSTDVDHLTKFIASFPGLFMPEEDNLDDLDPLTKKAIIGQHKLFAGILERLDPEFAVKIALEEWRKQYDGSYSVETPEPQIFCTPLEWKDLYKKWGVYFLHSPKGHRFLYSEKLSEVHKKIEMDETGVLQEGFCYSRRYPRSEVRIMPEVIVDAHSSIARGANHRLTRAKLRTIDTIKCALPAENKLKRGPLYSEPEDLRYEEMTRDLPSHRNAAISLARRAHRACKPPPERPLPRWLRRDPLKWSPAAEPPKLCLPAPYHPNRRAYEVNPHIPFRPLSLKPCPVSGKRLRVSRRHLMMSANAFGPVGASVAALGRIRLPPLCANLVKLRPISSSSVCDSEI